MEPVRKSRFRIENLEERIAPSKLSCFKGGSKGGSKGHSNKGHSNKGGSKGHSNKGHSHKGGSSVRACPCPPPPCPVVKCDPCC